MVIHTMCDFKSNQHDLPNWKCVFQCFSTCPSIPLLSGHFTPKMVKLTLVKNYARNHNQYILCSIDSLLFFSILYLVTCMDLGIQELFFHIFWPHTYVHKSKLRITLVFFHYMNNISVTEKLSHILLAKNWRYEGVVVLTMVQKYN